jgi:hypothetical protein
MKPNISGYLASRFGGLQIVDDDERDEDEEENESLLNGGRRESEGTSIGSQEDEVSDEDMYFEGVRKATFGGMKGGGYGFPMVGGEDDETYEEMMEEFNLILG